METMMCLRRWPGQAARLLAGRGNGWLRRVAPIEEEQQAMRDTCLGALPGFWFLFLALLLLAARPPTAPLWLFGGRPAGDGG